MISNLLSTLNCDIIILGSILLFQMLLKKQNIPNNNEAELQ